MDGRFSPCQLTPARDPGRLGWCCDRRSSRGTCALYHAPPLSLERTQTLLLEGQFKRCYRMDVASFERLLLMIRPALERDIGQSIRRTRTDPVTPENMLQMTISWLAGSNYHMTRNLAGASVPGFYSCLHAVMDAICEYPELRIRSPAESEEHMLKLADDFTSISADGIMTGCVGCIEGWLCHIRAPSALEVPDVAAFFSDHYQMYGVNVPFVTRFVASQGTVLIPAGKSEIL
ncbi:LOW QUALITY PROTEIN: hypothetical protein PHMEG_00026202 [Phytophthora megakarya]|uniref:Uncharacterized protein n=1 Tax=Phytophthora megakarya TaxID=4795 RepID=A0A225VBW1_9STRA|nr:LOW QUALITY PROTEIN: hypothetical protein PHMEG_00026202 [Phytophthora megakarya]